jgi:hypothetical protein
MRCYEFVNYTPENICRNDGIALSDRPEILVGDQVVHLADDIAVERLGVVYDPEAFDGHNRLLFADGVQLDGQTMLHAVDPNAPAAAVLVLLRLRRHGFHILRYDAKHPVVQVRIYDTGDADRYEEELLATLSPGERITVTRSKVIRFNGQAHEYAQFQNTIEFGQFGFPVCTPEYGATKDEFERRELHGE